MTSIKLNNLKGELLVVAKLLGSYASLKNKKNNSEEEDDSKGIEFQLNDLSILNDQNTSINELTDISKKLDTILLNLTKEDISQKIVAFSFNEQHIEFLEHANANKMNYFIEYLKSRSNETE